MFYRRILEAVNNTVAEFRKREDLECVFGEAVVKFTDAEDRLYDMFHEAGLSRKPKMTYRPGNTVITHYVPIVEKPCDMLRAHFESIWLAMEINRSIKGVFRDWGRLTSYTSCLVEWDEERHCYEWDDRIAAYVAGIGDIGPAGSLIVEGSYAGRASSILVDISLADKVEHEDVENVVATYLEKAYYAPVSVPAELISACPGNAISDRSIDRKRCQEYCASINSYTPCPEVCGKCFR